MLFSSVEFLFFFLPLSLALYFAVPERLRNGILLATSLVFYGWGEPRYLLLMVATVAANYLLGLLVSRAKRPRLWLTVAVVGNLALLGFFKYYDFFAASASLPTLGLALPVGISFYTFQALSYVIDVYRGERPLRNAVSFGAYITMFPQLVAGPIVRYGEVASALRHRTSSADRIAAGSLRFVSGLGKKVLLANAAGEVFDYFSAMTGNGLGTLGAWVGIVFYALQIYFDFSAYSDMAIGLGHIFGFSFPENFNYPYCAVSIRDFWTKWHISLSSWFREYLYIPLGGNRKGLPRTVLNMLIVWTLTGLWHGAGWNFLAWGTYYFLLLTAERLFLGKFLAKLPRPLRHLYTIVFVLIGWVFFAHNSLSTALTYLATMFGLSGRAVSGGELRALVRNALPLGLMLIGCTPVPRQMLYRFLREKTASGRILLTVGTLCLLFLCTAYLADASYNPFLYFRF